jgi:hypothetical protein
MFEHKAEPIARRRAFARRMTGHALVAVGFVIVSLLIGVVGYHWLERMSYVDSLLNASMLLGGMGPVGELHTVAGKLFASAYALFSGMVFLVVAAVLFAPVIHRFLHRFHLELAAEEGEGSFRKSLPGRERYRADAGRPSPSGGRTARPEAGSDSNEV